MRTKKALQDSVAEIPHSWSVTKAWPSHVWPHDGRRGAWLCRSRRNELVEAGALVRMGHELVVIGTGYSRWLARQAARVHGYQSNNPDLRRPDAA